VNSLDGVSDDPRVSNYLGVIPAKAGIQCRQHPCSLPLDSRLRGNDIVDQGVVGFDTLFDVFGGAADAAVAEAGTLHFGAAVDVA
jgi:hypothetical protein